MAYIKEYWNDKEKRTEKAKKHTAKMAKLYEKEIKNSIGNTIRYDENFIYKKMNEEDFAFSDIIIELISVDSVSALLTHKDCKSKIAVLNFSSYKNPGGMFLNGSKAQEECLCHESFLYNVLKEKQKEFYDADKKDLNRALYKNRALYTPNIVFERNDKGESCRVTADVITCAAPNKSTAQKYCNVTNKENLDVLKSRIKYIFNIAEDNQVETLILGAYGCGVFGQDATEVASIFLNTIKNINKPTSLKRIVFAIPKGNDKNYEKFKEVLNDILPVFKTGFSILK